MKEIITDTIRCKQIVVEDEIHLISKEHPGAAVTIWFQDGKPVIQLGMGKNTIDLTFSNSGEPLIGLLNKEATGGNIVIASRRDHSSIGMSTETRLLSEEGPSLLISSNPDGSIIEVEGMCFAEERKE